MGWAVFIICLFFNDHNFRYHIARQWIGVSPLGTIEVYASIIEVGTRNVHYLCGLDLEDWKFWIIVLPLTIVPVIGDVTQSSEIALIYMLVVEDFESKAFCEVIKA